MSSQSCNLWPTSPAPLVLKDDSCGTTGLNWSQDGALSVTREASHAQAASVQLFLMAQLGHNLAWQLSLLTCSCSASLLPIKVCRQAQLHPDKLIGGLPAYSDIAGNT